MVRKIQAKLVLRLHAQGLSGRAIARSQGMSRRSVSDVLDAARAVGVGWDDVAGKTDGEVYALLFPGRGERESVYEQPDWARVHRELARVGRDVEDPARRIRGRMPTDRETPYGLRPVLQAVRRIRAEVGLTSRVEHKAGRTIEVDWAGKTLRIVDPVTGDSSTAYLFVAVLPFSRYAFVEPTLDMAQNSWLRAHVAMYEWFGGSTPRLVCDNLKTGVIAHPREGRGRVERRVPGFGRALLGRRAARTGQEAEGQALGGEHRMARHDGVGRRDARPPVRLCWTSCGPRYARGSWNTIPARSRSVTDHVCRCSKARRSRC